LEERKQGRLGCENVYKILDNIKNPEDINKINDLLNDFINTYTDYDPYNKKIDWRKIDVKTLQ